MMNRQMIPLIVPVVAATLLIIAVNCASAPTGSDEQEFTDLTGDFFGQPMPGLTPVRFAPGVFLATSEWFWHGAPFFSPDLQEMYFVRYNVDGPMQIQFTEQVDGLWTMPRRPSFAQDNEENNPFISADGERIYFVSTRQGKQIYTAVRDGGGWTEPEPLGIPYPAGAYPGWQFSITRDGTVYFDMQTGGEGATYDIYRSRPVDGTYTTPESLGPGINSDAHDFAPFVDPDEEFLIFTSQREGGYGYSDIYICFRASDDTWSELIHPGPPVNSEASDVWPYIPWGGSQLFFVSRRDGDEGSNPYWVDVAIIETWRPETR